MIDKNDGLGWSYDIPVDKFDEMRVDIDDFSEKIDKDLGCTGCGFMLAFFNLSEKELNEFQKHYGYFPYDAYLSLWEKYTGKNQSYNQRNRCLDTLVKNNMISSTQVNLMRGSQVYKSSNNPFEKIVNRNRNLNTLID